MSPFLDRCRILAANALQRLGDSFRRKVDFVDECRGGEFPDRHFLVIPRGDKCGLTSYVFTALGGIKYALDHGMTPVVDMCSRPNIYLHSDEVGKCNAWEFYFEQPCGYSLSDIARAARVTIWRDYAWREMPSPDCEFLSGEDGRLAMWRELVGRYVRVRPDVKARVDALRERLFGGTMEGVLGVFVRGTDYVQLRPYQHPVQPDPGVVLDDVRRAVAQVGHRAVFLVTEDARVYELFRAEFGSRLQTVNADFVEYRGGYIGDCRRPESSGDDRRRRGEEYLASILLLAECRRSFESRAGGSVMAAIFASGSRSAHYYYQGLYGRFGVMEG